MHRASLRYRELQRPLGRWSDSAAAVLRRLMALALPAGTAVLPVHVLELQPTGRIGRHVDSLEYSGEHVVGLSLLSHAVMRLEQEERDGARLELLLPRRSMYALRGAARREWAHSIVDAADFDGKPLTPRQ